VLRLFLLHHVQKIASSSAKVSFKYHQLTTIALEKIAALTFVAFYIARS
jgi:hypothetical protein